MVEKLKIGLRIIVSLPVIILVLIIAIAAGLPALIGYLILMGVHVLSRNTIGKLPTAVQENPFFELLYMSILLPIVAISYIFYVPAVIACIPLMIYLYISEYLAGRWLEKHVFAPQNS